MSERPTFADRINAELEKLGQDPLTPAQARALEGAHGHSTLPQSEHGGLHPELRARLTAASALLGDYNARPENAPFDIWAMRLAADLAGMIRFIEEHQS